MDPSRGNPNKTWIIFITLHTAADFTSHPPAAGRERKEEREERGKERPVQKTGPRLKGQMIQNHQRRPFLPREKINTPSDPFSFASTLVWCSIMRYCSYSFQPFHALPGVTVSVTCGKFRIACVEQLVLVCNDKEWPELLQSKIHHGFS